MRGQRQVTVTGRFQSFPELQNFPMPGKPIQAPVKAKVEAAATADGNGNGNGNEASYYLLIRANGPCERFVKGEGARAAYKVLGGVRLIRVNRNGVEVDVTPEG